MPSPQRMLDPGSYCCSRFSVAIQTFSVVLRTTGHSAEVAGERRGELPACSFALSEERCSGACGGGWAWQRGIWPAVGSAATAQVRPRRPASRSPECPAHRPQIRQHGARHSRSVVRHPTDWPSPLWRRAHPRSAPASPSAATRAEHSCQAAGQQKRDARQSGEQSAAAQNQRVLSQPVGGMRDKRGGEQPRHHRSPGLNK